MPRHARIPLSRPLRAGFITILLAAAATLWGSGAFTSSAAAAEPPLDVHYVPTPHLVVERMLEMADVGSDDYVVDLGSGDGRIVIAAVRDYGARAGLGIDLDPQRLSEARYHARRDRVDDRVTFEQGDLFLKDFSDATVLTLYLLPSLNLRLKPIILERMAPGTRVVSHAFHMGDWAPDRHDIVDGRNVYLWIVPAHVAGQWRLQTADGSETALALNQRFQHIDGSATVDGAQVALGEATLRGAEIRFSIGSDRYVGRVEGDTITAVPQPGTVPRWHARRD
ncbi:MAG TPA: class I SAM-dependent methyltransferase [Rhodocyclaceae bacterium]|nr:class I SAM-dependent methyltransferase [Rhodocyclaceae bacterium]